MKRRSSAVWLVLLAALVPVWLVAQTPARTGPGAGAVLVNISKNSEKFASVFPQVVVSPVDPKVVAVAWRQYSLPIDTNAPKGTRTAECHVAISNDAGATFKDTNLMPYLRRERISADEPELWYCNAPWVAIASDKTIYAGGALYTANGVTGNEPKQGRARLTVSKDGGVTWSPGTHGITPTTFAPGTNAPATVDATPWDGANGLVDPKTGAFLTIAGGSFAISQDQAKTFSLVYQTTLPAGWQRQGNGTMSVSQGILGAPFFATAVPMPEAKCPCLAFGTSTDYGKTPLTPHLVAQADAINTSGTVRYPISAADRSRAGHFAVSAYTADHRHVAVHYTEDGGNTWKSASPAQPPASLALVNVNQTSVGYTTDGRILVVWRGYQKGTPVAPATPAPAAAPAPAPAADGAAAAGGRGAGGGGRGGGRGGTPEAVGPFHTFAALLDKGVFGPTIQVSAEISTHPKLIAAGNYGATSGGGDFTTWITGNDQFAFVAFPYAPGGAVDDTYLAKIPLSSMR